MHVCETVEVAGLLCLNARPLLEDCGRVSEQAIADYWAASRCRMDEWGYALRGFEQFETCRLGDIRPIADEVLIAQVLTRTLAAVAVAHDRRHGVDEAGPIARNVVASQAESVARLRSLLRSHGQRSLDPIKPLNERVKRWTDLLLGYVAPLCATPGADSPAGHAIEFAFDPCRVQEFAYDGALHESPNRSAWPLLQASIRSAFSAADAPPASPELNRRVAGAAIGLLGPEAFDSHGLLRSAFLSRVERVADDTLGLVEQLFDEPTAERNESLPRWHAL
ncbi:MAG: hypothetical protein AAGG46_06330 [Planctomycetota bacterium]